MLLTSTRMGKLFAQCKWSKGKTKEKVNNMVLFDKPSYDKLLAEAPKYKLITPSVLSDRLRIIIKIAAGNGVGKILVGKDGVLSTPAVSAVIRKRKANGGFIMSASHNPGGPEYDRGIKFNYSSGQPAPESITDKIYGNTLSVWICSVFTDDFTSYPMEIIEGLVDTNCIFMTDTIAPVCRFLLMDKKKGRRRSALP